MNSPGNFRIRRVAMIDRGFHYETYLVEGYLSGQRVRRKFQSRGGGRS